MRTLLDRSGKRRSRGPRDSEARGEKAAASRRTQKRFAHPQILDYPLPSIPTRDRTASKGLGRGQVGVYSRALERQKTNSGLNQSRTGTVKKGPP